MDTELRLWRHVAFLGTSQNIISFCKTREIRFFYMSTSRIPTLLSKFTISHIWCDTVKIWIYIHNIIILYRAFICMYVLTIKWNEMMLKKQKLNYKWAARKEVNRRKKIIKYKHTHMMMMVMIMKEEKKSYQIHLYMFPRKTRIEEEEA